MAAKLANRQISHNPFQHLLCQTPLQYIKFERKGGEKRIISEWKYTELTEEEVRASTAWKYTKLTEEEVRVTEYFVEIYQI